MVNVIITKDFKSQSTQEIKNELLEMVKGRDTEPLSTKVNFSKNELLPYFERMSENFKQGIFCHSERNEVERRIPISR